MTTVTPNIDESLHDKAKIGLQQSGITMGEFISKALAPYAEGEVSIRKYESLLKRHFIMRPAKPQMHKKKGDL